MFTRRQVNRLSLLSLASPASGLTSSGVARRAAAAQFGESNLHAEDWFLESFLVMQDDLEEATAAGKTFAVVWEQRGCHYCRDLHEVNLARDDIRVYLQDNFLILQLDLWGSREVTDFDGEALEERAMARKWAINFTPTIQFFAPESAAGKPANQVEVARMPGYLRPFDFLAMFEFVREERYKEVSFQRYLQDKIAAYKSKGVDPEAW